MRRQRLASVRAERGRAYNVLRDGSRRGRLVAALLLFGAALLLFLFVFVGGGGVLFGFGRVGGFSAAFAHPGFGVSGDHFVWDGKPFRLLAGEFHPFRVPRAQWGDRLAKMRLGGLNAVSIYLAWNLHEPRRGTFVFDGDLDVVAFVREAQRSGLLVVLRPGPYICAEWDFGGLPAWLLRDRGATRVRTSDPRFLQAADAYLEKVLRMLAPLQYNRGGGPIVAAQVENEYNSFGSDSRYMAHLVELFRRCGFGDSVLFASNNRRALSSSEAQGLLRTVNFGFKSNGTEALRRLRRVQKTGPLFVTEFWNGWFDHWSEDHHTVPLERLELVLREILDTGASVCFYMYSGGTNFGFMNGANFNYSTNAYEPTVTSYDYDAPITEWGDVREQWSLIRRVIADYSDPTQKQKLLQSPPPPKVPKASYGKVSLSPVCSLLDEKLLTTLGHGAVHSEWTMTMEELGQNHGFVLYQTWATANADELQLRVWGLRDRAQVFVGNRMLGVLTREKTILQLPEDAADTTLEIRLLVENMGRINYGQEMIRESKGVLQGVAIGDRFLANWSIVPLPLEAADINHLLASSACSSQQQPRPGEPTFFTGEFTVDEAPQTTFLDMDGWSKGSAWINGHNLGRFWTTAGPQRALYVPPSWLARGRNILVLLELEPSAQPSSSAALVSTPMLAGDAEADRR